MDVPDRVDDRIAVREVPVVPAALLPEPEGGLVRTLANRQCFNQSRLRDFEVLTDAERGRSLDREQDSADADRPFCLVTTRNEQQVNVLGHHDERQKVEQSSGVGSFNGVENDLGDARITQERPAFVGRACQFVDMTSDVTMLDEFAMAR
ncbi:MAG: hypothetical protein AAGI30_02290 [Planctomycetota bacterium]